MGIGGNDEGGGRRDVTGAGVSGETLVSSGHDDNEEAGGDAAWISWCGLEATVPPVPTLEAGLTTAVERRLLETDPVPRLEVSPGWCSWA